MTVAQNYKCTFFKGNKWHERRRILTPAFHFNILKKYTDIIIENSEKMIEILKIEKIGESDQNLLDLITNYTLSVICGKYIACFVNQFL